MDELELLIERLTPRIVSADARLATESLEAGEPSECLSNLVSAMFLSGVFPTQELDLALSIANSFGVETETEIRELAALRGWLATTKGSPDEIDPLGRTALHYAALRGDEPVAIELVALGQRGDCRDRFGMTPLHLSVRRGCVGLVRLLLGNSGSVDIRDENGHTPLYWAVRRPRPSMGVLEALLEAGADPELGPGQTPLGLARLLKDDGIRRLFERVAK